MLYLNHSSKFYLSYCYLQHVSIKLLIKFYFAWRDQVVKQSYIVIGASSGIGAAIAEDLIQNDFRVIALNRKEPTLNSANLEFYRCDMTDLSSDLPDVEGPIEGLVYLPGSINLKPFESISEKDFREDWEINFFGAMRAIRKYLPNLKAAQNSSIVLMSTVAVSQGMSYHTSISAAKGAIEGATRSLAAEFAPKIRVNAVAPSLTETPLAKNLIGDENRKKHAAARHPLQRIGNPIDAANAALFLLSKKSSWVTGQVIHVDGGFSTIKII